MKKLHILISGTIGGIERLCEDFYNSNPNLNHLCFIKRIGDIYDDLKEKQGVISVFDNCKLKISYIKHAFNLIDTYCKKENIKKIIMHHNTMFNQLLGLKLLKNKYQVYFYVHSDVLDIFKDSNFMMQNIKKYLLNKSLKKSTGIIAISHFVSKSIMTTFNIDNSKIKVVYNGIRTNQFNLTSNKVPNNPLRLVYVGRLIQEKGVQFTLKLLSKTNVPFTFDIIGSGPYIDNLKKLTSELCLDSKVRFLGSRRDVKLLLKNYDVFVHVPMWNEGFGITIIEALASGLVCIVSNKGALAEIICNEKNGFIIKDEMDFENFNLIMNKISKGLDNVFYNNILDSAKKFDISNTILNINEI